jgi:predicted transcriptional regulator
VDEKVHRLFVVDESGVLVGVVSALDVLRRIQ